MSKHQKLQWDDDVIKRFWDYESQFKQNYFAYAYGDVIIGKFLPYFPASGNVLDYGCGTGFLIKHLLETNLNVGGVDFSRDSLDFVNSTYGGNPQFSGCLMPSEIDNKKSEADVIFCVEVLEHLSDEELENTMNTIKFLLKKEGVVIFTVPNRENLKKSEVYCPGCNKTHHRWQHIRTWNKKKLCNYLQKSGFNIVESFETNFKLTLKKGVLTYLKHKLISIYSKQKHLPHLVVIVKSI